MTRVWITYEKLVEVVASCLVHLLCGVCFFCSAISLHFFHSPMPHWKKVEHTNSTETKADCDLPPVVWVHGFLPFGPFDEGRLGCLSNFGDQRVLVPHFGSLTSVYDRARELFYYLKGGQVDYGKEHSKACGHSQFGRIYEQGQYPEWDKDHPIHFVGQSAGAQVVRVLQQMLADKAFKGYENTSENWLLSITSLSGALNGTTRTYIHGMQAEDGKTLKPICLIQLCRIGAIMYEWFDIPWLKRKRHYNLGLDHFNMSWKNMGILGLMNCLMRNSSGPFASGDWILPDLTIQGSMTHWSHPPHVSAPYEGYRDEEWQENDGAVNTISMTHPRFPIEHPSCFLQETDNQQLLKPGIWYYRVVEADHPPSILDRERAAAPFDSISDAIFERCRNYSFSNKTPNTA